MILTLLGHKRRENDLYYSVFDLRTKQLFYNELKVDIYTCSLFDPSKIAILFGLFSFYQRSDTSAGGLLVPVGIMSQEAKVEFLKEKKILKTII